MDRRARPGVAPGVPVGSRPRRRDGRGSAACARLRRIPCTRSGSSKDRACVPIETACAERRPAALLFRAADFPPAASETVEHLLRTVARARAARRRSGFLAVGSRIASERERPELTRRLPDGPLRILDAGCGAGGGIPARSRGVPAGRDRDRDGPGSRRAGPRAPATACSVGDLARILPELEAAGERFDAFVFADVLEHLEDPVAALAAARRLAAPGARLLVASVPNVGPPLPRARPRARPLRPGARGPRGRAATCAGSRAARSRRRSTEAGMARRVDRGRARRRARPNAGGVPRARGGVAGGGSRRASRRISGSGRPTDGRRHDADRLPARVHGALRRREGRAACRRRRSRGAGTG